MLRVYTRSYGIRFNSNKSPVYRNDHSTSLLNRFGAYTYPYYYYTCAAVVINYVGIIFLSGLLPIGSHNIVAYRHIHLSLSLSLILPVSVLPYNISTTRFNPSAVFKGLCLLLPAIHSVHVITWSIHYCVQT